MIELFLKGGPVMWPLLVVSIVTLSVVVDRCLFLGRIARGRARDKVSQFFDLLERGEREQARQLASQSQDYVLQTLGYGLQHAHLEEGHSTGSGGANGGPGDFQAAIQYAAFSELEKFERGLSTLDTSITLSPLLGLLGTVTGMIHAFGLLGANELSAPAAITGGIAEALLATAFGLGIAITALLPFNILTRQLEKARFEIQNAATRLELILKFGSDGHQFH